MENYHERVSDRMLRFERLLNAPRELVFEAWTNPEHLANWWGPTGFSLSTRKMEVAPNGIWQFIMHGPDGRDYPNKIKYLELVKPSKIVYQHVDDGESEPVSFTVTVTFDDKDGKTALRMEMLFPSAAELERIAREYGAVEGGRQTLGRLQELLDKLLQPESK